MTTQADDLLKTLPILNPDPAKAGEQVRAYLRLHAPELGHLEGPNLARMLRVFGLQLQSAVVDNALFKQGGSDAGAAAHAMLWCHSGDARFAWNLENTHADVPISTLNWVSAMILGHWLVHAPWIGEFTDTPRLAEPLQPPSFVCAAHRLPVTHFEHQAAAFAGGFLLPANELIAALDDKMPIVALRAIVADADEVEALAEAYDMPRWAAAYRLRDVIAEVEYRLRSLNS